MFSVHIQTETIDLTSQAGVGRDDCGARVRFVGTVRNDARSAPLSHLVLEHFPGVTESEIERIVALARRRWALQAVRVVHRVGHITVGEDIVLVDTFSAHRKDAYEANVFIMDYLKTQAPFWKQECFADGLEHWVEAKGSDQQAAQRWSGGAAAAQGERVEFDATPHRIGALILAGGQGSRMGYRNKGLQTLHGRPLAMHVADALRPHVQYLAASANRNIAAYEAMGFPVFRDDPDCPVKGPLAGIASALPQFPAWLDALLVVPCDLPRLPADLVSRLAAALAAPGIACSIASTQASAHHGVFMCRPGMLATLVPHLLGEPDPRLRAWLARSSCATVSFPDTAAFVNVNDLQTLQGLDA